MEFNKINNLLDTAYDKVPKFVTKDWIEVQNLSGGGYDTSKQIRFKTSMFRCDLCDYSEAYVWVKGDATASNEDNNINFDRKCFRNNAPFLSCISKLTTN